MLRAVSSQGGAPGNFSTLTVTGQGLFADGSAAAPSISFINTPTSGIFRNSGSGLATLAASGTEVAAWQPGEFRLGSNGIFSWTSAINNPNGTIDSSVMRDAAGLLGVRNSLAVRGGAGFGAKAIAGSYSVTQDDFTICCSTATQGFTVLLPSAPAMNQYLNIKKVSADANRLTIDGNGNLIDALSTQSTILTTRPNFALQFGSTVASPTGSGWQLL